MTTISTLPTAPSRKRPSTFSEETDAFLAALPEFVTETNALGAEVSSTAQTVSDDKEAAETAAAEASMSANIAISASNYKGKWSDLTGAYSAFISVYHVSKYWILENSTTDITTIEPGVSSEWSELPTPSGSKQFVASGNIASAGLAVNLKSDGTVEVVESTGSPASVGPSTAFNSSSTSDISVAYDSTNDKIIIAYSDASNSSYGTAIVGTVSGTSINFGTAVVFESGVVSDTSIVFDSTSGNVIIAYSDASNSSYGTAIVGTVSGTSISFGTAVVFESGSTSEISATYDSTNDKIVIVYADVSNSSYGTAIVGTVSGTSISFGTAVVFESANTQSCSIVFDSSNDKIVIAYKDYGNSSRGTAIVGTVSGTSISFGTAVVFETGRTENIRAVFDTTNDKIVIAYQNYDDSQNGAVIVGTVSGTSISFGTETTFNTGEPTRIAITYDRTNDKIVIAYNDTDNSNYGTAIVGTVSGTSISFSGEYIFESSFVNSQYPAMVFDSTSEQIIIAYQNYDSTYYGTAVTFKNDDVVTNVDNTVGLSTIAANNGDTTTIRTLAGIDNNGSGLTVNDSYYVQYDGTITNTPDTDYNHVFLGKAVSSSEILIGEITIIEGNL